MRLPRRLPLLLVAVAVVVDVVVVVSAVDDVDGFPADAQSSGSTGIRRKRYVIRSKRWRKNKLTWKLLQDNLSDGDEYVIRNTLHRAFNEWAAVAAVSFEEVEASGGVEQPTDITVAFERRDHGDSYSFDGKDGVVAHAFYPRDGRLHFDADESWTLNSPDGVNLYQTAVHEVGHLLGLEHSVDSRAAMFGAKRPYDPAFGLGDDDVRAIRALFPPKMPAEIKGPSVDEQLLQAVQVVENLQAARRHVVDLSENHDGPEENVERKTDDVGEKSTSTPRINFANRDNWFFPFPLPNLAQFQERNERFNF